MKIQGNVYKIFQTQQVSEKFKKRDMILEINNGEPYVQKVSFTAIMNNVDILDSIKEGQEVEVDFKLNGKEWNSPNGEVKYFNTIVINSVEALTDAPQEKGSNFSNEELTTPVNLSDDDDDDLPF
jgi:regulatory protein YycH of two-component signal transduction system YycFG